MSLTDGMVLKGDVFFSRLTNGVYAPLVDLAAGELSTKFNSKTVRVIGKGRNNYGQSIASTVITEPAELTVSFGRVSPKALAMGLQGTVTAYTQASGTATDEVVAANKGGYVDLAFRNVAAAGFALKNSAGSTTYVKDTDYTVDYVTGQLFILETSAITDAQSLKVSYTYNAVTADKVNAGASSMIRGKLFLKGQNVFDDSQAEITVWDAVLTSESSVDWLSDKPIEIKLKGDMVIPAGRTSAFELITNFVNS